MSGGLYNKYFQQSKLNISLPLDKRLLPLPLILVTRQLKEVISMRRSVNLVISRLTRTCSLINVVKPITANQTKPNSTLTYAELFGKQKGRY
jgi:hypothetical protein